MKTTSKLFILVFTFMALTASAYAQSPREQLKQMVQQLQKAPNDNALREKVIKLAQDVKPALAVPPEARRAFVMGGTYQKEAKSPEDFGLAVKAFQDASTAAPWWGDAYYNLSVALESAKRYDEAKNALTLYLLTKPKDAEQAQERLYAIEAKKNLAARAASVAEERKKNSIEGTWLDGRDGIPILRIERIGETLVVKSANESFSFSGARITETNLSVTNTPLIPGMLPVRYEFELRGDKLVGTANGRPYQMNRKP
ncbi:MAG: tetratricopeptide repeat protein [Sulfuricaulis sp.]|uniref:tetratricopeptide repeat protein n=1 Tax=Sulfuricaulis sp. TaxID=2003553 RepID=UPI0025CEEC0F|nr:tetratricopeptide repeat protein [Sulfuricaulis sp.]MCR4346173.1 tetratricopeptide repeat protein [Sulfuricaulis sp.]